MSSKNDIINKINDLLDISGAQKMLRLNSGTIERAYEAYILGLCKRAVEAAGGTATLTGINTGANPDPIILRGAPGSMASTKQDFCYISCRLHEKSFEIHLDVLYEGTSGATHEIDVSFYEKTAADSVRNFSRLPKVNKLIMVFECKFYEMSVPSTVLGRQFAGLVKDCSSNRFNAFVSNNASQNLKKYFSNKSNLEPFPDLDPQSKDSEDRFVKNVEQALRKWAI